MTDRSEKRIDIFVNLICLIPVIITILVYMYSLRFMLLSADDFANAIVMRDRMSDGTNRWVATWQSVTGGYLGQQGTWFSSILHFFPLSFEIFRGLWAVRIYQLVADMIFFGGLLLFVRTIMSRYTGQKRYGWIFTLVFWIAMNYAAPGENLFWMNGSAVYTIPFGIALISLTIYMFFLERSSLLLLILACVFAFLSTGGSLIVGGFLNACTLCLIIAEYRNKRRVGAAGWVFFGVCFLGALVNTLAPGNFVRHENYVDGGSLFIGEAVRNSFLVIGDRFIRLANKGYLISVVVAVIVVSAVCIKRIPNIEDTRITPIGAALGSFGVIYASFFPPVLAFNTTIDNPYLGIRVDFITGWIISIAVIFVCIYTVIWLKTRLTKTSEEDASRNLIAGRSFAVIAVLVISVAAIGTNAISLHQREIETYIPRFYYELAIGRLKSYYETRRAALDMYEHTDAPVAVWTEWLTVSRVMKDMELSADSSWWVNQVIAAYYGREAVLYSPPLEDYEIHKDE